MSSSGLFKGTFLAQAAHPCICLLHFSFKTLAFVCYLFHTMFTYSAVGFVTVLLLAALDFWTVQNITGRLLVGLRWRSVLTETGGERWVFESWSDNREANSVDRWMFWLGIVLACAVWGLFTLANALTFNILWVRTRKALCCFLAAAMGVANALGYWKCRGDHKRKLQAMVGMGLSRIITA